MTLDELIADIIDRGWEIDYLRGPDHVGHWEAYIISRWDADHIRLAAHSRQPTPVEAIYYAVYKMDHAPDREQFAPDLGTVAPSPRSLLEELGLAKPSPPAPFPRRI